MNDVAHRQQRVNRAGQGQQFAQQNQTEAQVAGCMDNSWLCIGLLCGLGLLAAGVAQRRQN